MFAGELRVKKWQRKARECRRRAGKEKVDAQYRKLLHVFGGSINYKRVTSPTPPPLFEPY